MKMNTIRESKCPSCYKTKCMCYEKEMVDMYKKYRKAEDITRIGNHEYVFGGIGWSLNKQGRIIETPSSIIIELEYDTICYRINSTINYSWGKTTPLQRLFKYDFKLFNIATAKCWCNNNAKIKLKSYLSICDKYDKGIMNDLDIVEIHNEDEFFEFVEKHTVNITNSIDSEIYLINLKNRSEKSVTLYTYDSLDIEAYVMLKALKEAIENEAAQNM
jgi:hypothetical protein